MEKRSITVSLEQISHNHPISSRATSNSARNSQNVKSNKEVEQKPKRTRRRYRKPKYTVDNVSNVPIDINSLSIQDTIKKKVMAATSINNSISNDMAGGEHVKETTTNRQIKTKYTFIIIPVRSHRTGQFIRKRNSKYKYVNLKSFINSTTRLPCIFTTNWSSIKNTVSNFKQSVNIQENMTKSERRKYPQFLHENEPSTSSTNNKIRRKEKRRCKDVDAFPNYIDEYEVGKGLSNGSLTKGFVRINPKNFKDSYVNNEDTSQADYYLTSVVDRNRALEGDEVILRVKPPKNWIDGKKTATVVFITQLVNPRIVVGTLKPLVKQNSEFATLFPRDKRMPILRIPAENWPNGFKNNSKQYEKILFVAKIVDWLVPSFAQGVLIENLGLSGDLRVEGMSILREFCLDITPFGPEVAEYLPKSSDIPQKELIYREDIRKKCVFTIDPPTAKDLDDAVSVTELPNGNYEIGVHISDVSFYLKGGTELDRIVSKKATTIYLVDKVYHMLPIELCLQCSLLPGQDKLSFSVFWEMTENGDIINKRFTRTILNSCTQLAYNHAQMIIENPDNDFSDTDFPVIHNGFSVADLKKTIKVLQNIAVKLRERRMQNGSLKIDQVKLSFDLDVQTGEPLNFYIYENKDSHRLIEEFMLLANISVAERIYEVYPNIAFLRCHEPPKNTMLVELQNTLSIYGIHIDISSSRGLNDSLRKYITDDFLGQCRSAVLNHIMAKAMTRAQYFCAATMNSELDYRHYALSVPIYTHFTSPIRRYADIMVHRLLAASLDYCEKLEWDIDYVSAIAANCNGQKYNAKKAGDASSDLYLAHYVENHQPYEQDCVVVDIKERSFDAIVLKTGSIVRIYQNKCVEGISWKTESVGTIRASDGEEKKTVNGKNIKGENEKKLLRLKITYPKMDNYTETTSIIEMFTLVKVLLDRKPNSYKLDAILLRPIPTQTFTRQ